MLLFFSAHKQTAPFVIRSEVCGDAAVKTRQTATGIWSDFMLEQRWLTTCKIHPQRMLMEAWNMAKKWIGSHRAHVFFFFGEMLWTILKRKSLKSRCEYLLWHQWSYSSALEVCFHTAVSNLWGKGVPGFYDAQINVSSFAKYCKNVVFWSSLLTLEMTATKTIQIQGPLTLFYCSF